VAELSSPTSELPDAEASTATTPPQCEGGGGVPGRVAGLRGQTGRLAVGPFWAEGKKNSFLNKNLIFDYSKALEICRRRFRRNFDMRIFPKFF
jgi:hypothetical protein